jgi:hypothetical protein
MVGLARTVPGRRRRLPEANVWQVWLTPVFISARFLNANRDPLRLKTLLETRRRTMTGETRYRALFLGAGPQMHCGVGQFTRLLQETIEKLEPGTSATLTLTRSEGSLAEIWRAVGTAQSVVCNFPIVAWKRVMFAPLAAMAIARMRRRKVVLIQHEWNGLHCCAASPTCRRCCWPTPSSCSSLVRRELANDPARLDRQKERVCAAAEHRSPVDQIEIAARLIAAKGDGGF